MPLEKVQEDMHHQLHGAHGASSQLMNRGALLSAVLAVLAAISALMAGHDANEAMLAQIQSSDHWAYYQAKGIKLAISQLRIDLSHDHDAAEKAAEKAAEYKREQEEIKREAELKDQESKGHLHRHESLATAVTFFQVAIAMTAIAVLTRKRRFLVFASGLGGVGLVWMLKSLFLG